MPQFAANLSTMFTEVPFEERFAAAAQAGFKAVECMFPYVLPPDGVAALLQHNGLRLVLFNLYAGDWEQGERGLAAQPGREQEFSASLERALAYCKATGCALVHPMAGLVPESADAGKRQEMETVYAANLAKAADFFAPHGVTVVIEAINQRSIPGYFLRTQGQAAAYLEQLGKSNLKLQFDFFHVQMEEGCVALKFKELFPLIGHCQLAGVPDRHEPDSGELDYRYIFHVVDSMQYAGYIGCEYLPAGETRAGLGWLETIGSA